MLLRFRILAAVILLALTSAGIALGWSEPKILSPNAANIEESDSPATVTDGETIVVEKPDLVMSSQTPWQAPNYLGQEGALGWSAEVFKIPAPMIPRVNFWIDVYTKYTTDQGLLHDSQHVNLVYESIDFNSIMKDPSLTDRQKQKARHKLVDDKKKEIRDRLARLATFSSAEGLTGEDLRIWNIFTTINEPNKFHEAGQRKHLRFQLGQKDRFLQGLYYSGRYLKNMEAIFREQGLPIELTRLPFVESSFNVKARSRVGASGIWQFMRYTGKRFMRVNYVVDERNDPLRATKAAARLFRLNFEMLGQWPLAITGYNHGPAGVQKIVRKFNTDNISDLVDERHGRFGFASANFFACFLAALEVEKNAAHYFGDKVFWDSPIDTREIQLARSINRKVLTKWYGGDVEKAKEMNQHIQRTFWMGYSSLSPKDIVRVPTKQYELALEDLKTITTLSVDQDGPKAAQGTEFYVIGQGETLSEIASQFGLSVSHLIDINGIENPRRLRAGQKILVPKK